MKKHSEMIRVLTLGFEGSLKDLLLKAWETSRKIQEDAGLFGKENEDGSVTFTKEQTDLSVSYARQDIVALVALCVVALAYLRTIKFCCYLCLALLFVITIKVW